MDKQKRLTEKTTAGVNEIVVHKNCKEDFCRYRHCENCQNQVEVFERLFELENKLESGQLVEWPGIREVSKEGKALREILYRGQIRRKGEKVKMGTGEPLPGKWCYGGIFAPHTVKEGFAVIYGSESGDVEPITGSKLGKFPVYRDTVGEYTGVTDKNDKRIFEDDIARVKYEGKCYLGVIQRSALGSFIFTSRGFGWVPLYALADDSLEQQQGRRITAIEVIGNIHDTPELLDDKSAK